MITEDILYFAKFPAKAGVLENFKRTENVDPEYTALKTQVEALPDTSIIPEIEDYLFSVHEEVIENRIRNIKKYFLLFQYGIIRSPAHDRAGIRKTTLASSLIVARKISLKATDVADESIYLEKTLQYIVQIANQMRDDNKTLFCAPERFAESNIDIAPVEPGLLYGCIGWVMTFNRNKHLLID